MNNNIPLKLKSNRSRAPINQRFGRYVYLLLSNGCWEWRGAKNERGYGLIGKEGGRGAGNIRAHRLSYQIFYNVNLTREQCVCHKCDNPPCVNPDHLFVGSQQENILDMFAKARNSKPPLICGEANHMAKLTKQDVIEIRQLYDHGLSSPKIAKLFFVTKSTILAIVNRKIWRHV
jgi:hypothetical protein